MGTIVPKGQTVSLTAKIVTTDTAEIVGAGRAQFTADTNVEQMVSTQAATSGSGGGDATSLDKDAIKVSKKLGNLSVGLQSLQLVNGGRQYLLTMQLSNTSKTKSIWVAMNGGMVGTAHQSVFDPNNFEFVNADRDVSGLPSTLFQYPANAFTEATEIMPGDSTEVTIAFHSTQSRNATAGQCRVQLGFLLGNDFNNGYGLCTKQSFMAKMDAE